MTGHYQVMLRSESTRRTLTHLALAEYGPWQTLKKSRVYHLPHEASVIALCVEDLMTSRVSCRASQADRLLLKSGVCEMDLGECKHPLVILMKIVVKVVQRL